jgi:hypothetical protein
LTLSVFAASPVRVDGDVKVVTSQNSFRSDGGKGANRVSNEQAHLEFKVRNVTESEEKMEVRWWLFARGIGSTSGALRVAEGGSKEMTVAPRQVADFKSGSHTFHREEAQSQAFRPGQKLSLKERQEFGKHTEGVKFAGYGVQLISGGQVLDSKFTSDDLAAHVGASRNTPGKKSGGGGKK